MEKVKLKDAIKREWNELKEKRAKYLKDTEGSFIKKLPNMLTYIRTAFAVVIPILTIIWPFAALIVAIIIALTDTVDGIIARKYDAVSEYGAFWDSFADKLLSLALVCSLLRVSIFYPLFILFGEAMISLVNIIAEIVGKHTYSCLMGKAKAWVISVAAIVGLATLTFPEYKELSNNLFLLAIITQWLTVLSYIYLYFLKPEGNK